MNDIRIESFARTEGISDDFYELPRKIEGLNEKQAAAEEKGTRSLLRPDNTSYRDAEYRAFVAYRGDQPAGRLTAFHNSKMAELHGPYGLVGLFSCEDDRGVARALIDAAAEWLGSQGNRIIRGPMAADIWHRWRFMTRGFDTPPFPGEPRQPAYYPELFKACGFAIVRTYSTKKITDLNGMKRRLKTARDLNRKRGYTYRNIDTRQWEKDMAALHELCQYSFASNWGVTPITLEEFSDIYNRWLRRVGYDDIILAIAPGSDEVVGLGLAVSAPKDTLNIRTLAVKPKHHGYGLGQAIAAELYERAVEKGQKIVHHCQMGPDAPPQRWDGGLAQVTREYEMYERGIG